MKANPLLGLAILTGLFTTPTRSSAQDDSYENVQFVNATDKTVEITYWNPRDDGDPFIWNVEAGKTLDFSDKEGKKLRVGIYSSQISVNKGPAKAIVSVSDKSADNSMTVITWTETGYKNEDKPVP